MVIRWQLQKKWNADLPDGKLVFMMIMIFAD